MHNWQTPSSNVARPGTTSAFQEEGTVRKQARDSTPTFELWPDPVLEQDYDTESD